MKFWVKTNEKIIKLYIFRLRIFKRTSKPSNIKNSRNIFELKKTDKKNSSSNFYNTSFNKKISCRNFSALKEGS